MENKNEYFLKKEERLEEHKYMSRRRLAKRFLKYFTWAVVILGLVGGLGYWAYNLPKTTEEDILSACVQHTGIGMHIHPNLSIVIKGEKVPLPANIGISPVCMRPIHTHDNSGTLHLEFARKRDVRLGELFKIWDKQFNATCILDRCNGPEGNVKMFVNSQPNNEFENYIMRDKDMIEIRYE